MKKTILALIVGLAVLVPSVALASSSSCQAYGSKTCTTSDTTSTTTTTSADNTDTSTDADSTTATTASGTLPFTGLDLAALLVGASVLIGAGLVVRYLSRDQHN